MFDKPVTHPSPWDRQLREICRAVRDRIRYGTCEREGCAETAAGYYYGEKVCAQCWRDGACFFPYDEETGLTVTPTEDIFLFDGSGCERSSRVCDMTKAPAEGESVNQHQARGFRRDRPQAGALGEGDTSYPTSRSQGTEDVAYQYVEVTG